MLAMQYKFTLPADYDMALIQKRIASKGPLLDGFPQLVLKAFLFARRNHPHYYSEENQYAPFYLWEDSVGMNRFLSSDGFQGLVKDFGWPKVKMWSVWRTRLGASIGSAAFASTEVVQIQPHTILAKLEQEEEKLVNDVVDSGKALGAMVAFEPITWTMVRFRLTNLPDPALPRRRTYEVGHLSGPRQLALIQGGNSPE